VAPREDAPAFVAAAREAGVLIGAVGPKAVRIVTHLDISKADAERAAAVLGRL
jgi:threonine aldolase